MSPSAGAVDLTKNEQGKGHGQSSLEPNWP
jgi:hypothetical protein